MRYSFTALVLATVTLTGVVAQPSRHAHGHAAFHNKREHADELVQAEAEVKRDPGLADVDWSKVHYTYSAGQTWGDATAAPVAAAPAATAAAAVAAAVADVAAAVPTKAAAAVSGAVSGAVGAVSNVLSSVASTKLTKLGFAGVGTNAKTSAGGIWLGSDGKYTNTFVNNATDDVILVVWGSWASWVNAKVPLITVSLAPGEKTVVSFADGSIGAWSGVYPDTPLVNGQVSNTWGEFTFTPSGVVDVSMEVNMKGRGMTIVGPTCTSDMNTCVFQCDSGDVCTTGYSLKNCANGSQKGATYGKFEGTDSGGCGWNGASSAALTTTFH